MKIKRKEALEIMELEASSLWKNVTLGFVQ